MNNIQISTNSDNNEIEISTSDTNNSVNATTNTNSVTASTDKNYGDYYADKAKEWAIREDNKVDGIDYSSKYYANQSKSSQTVCENIQKNLANVENSTILSIREETTNSIEELHTKSIEEQKNIENKASEQYNVLSTDLQSKAEQETEILTRNLTEHSNTLKSEITTLSNDKKKELNTIAENTKKYSLAVYNPITDTGYLKDCQDYAVSGQKWANDALTYSKNAKNSEQNAKYWAEQAKEIGKIATSESAGIVKPDNDTITIDEYGTITANYGNIKEEIEQKQDKLTSGDNINITKQNNLNISKQEYINKWNNDTSDNDIVFIPTEKIATNGVVRLGLYGGQIYNLATQKIVVQSSLFAFDNLFFVNNKFVAIGKSNIAISDNGETWENIENNIFAENIVYYHKILYANNLYIACGKGVLTSLDGKSWVKQTMPVDTEDTQPTERIYDVAYNGEYFITSTDNSFLYKSTDFANWEEITPIVTGDDTYFKISNIEYSNNKFICYSKTRDTIFISTDGVNYIGTLTNIGDELWKKYQYDIQEVEVLSFIDNIILYDARDNKFNHILVIYDINSANINLLSIKDNSVGREFSNLIKFNGKYEFIIWWVDANDVYVLDYQFNLEEQTIISSSDAEFGKIKGNIENQTELYAELVQIGTITQSGTTVNNYYKQCDGSHHTAEELPKLYALTPAPITYYRLCNITRGMSYWQELWTTDINICKKRNPDLKHLYRRIGTGFDFVPIQEKIEMSYGEITSESKFYDGIYEVPNGSGSMKQYKHTNYGHTAVELGFMENKDLIDTNCISKFTEDTNGIYTDGIDNMFSTNGLTDGVMADNFYMTSIADGKKISFGYAGTEIDVTNKFMETFDLIFDFVTPPTFVATRDIFFGYRSLIFRIADTTGKLNMYMAGFKSSNSLRWRHSNISTGITLKPNTRYSLHFYKSDLNGTTPPFTYTLDISEYTIDDDGSAYLKDYATFELTSNYYPYDYYNNFGMRTLYHADATAWVAGQFIDLSSLSINYTLGDVAEETIPSKNLTYHYNTTYTAKKGIYLPRTADISYIKIK